MFQRQAWKYGEHIQNRNYLEDDKSFDELAQEMVNAAEGVDKSRVSYQMEPPNNDQLLIELRCSRPSWRIQFDSKLLDEFFNGIMGIRAQYYISPYVGREKNLSLLSSLKDQLIKLATSIDCAADRTFLQMSLQKSSAKVWICEKDLSGNKLFDFCV